VRWSAQTARRLSPEKLIANRQYEYASRAGSTEFSDDRKTFFYVPTSGVLGSRVQLWLFAETLSQQASGGA